MVWEVHLVLRERHVGGRGLVGVVVTFIYIFLFYQLLYRLLENWWKHIHIVLVLLNERVVVRVATTFGIVCIILNIAYVEILHFSLV